MPWCEISTNFDLVFWLGSLQYSISGSDEEFAQAIQDKAWEALLDKDSFLEEQKRAGVLYNFTSGKHCFAPTFPLMTDIEATKVGMLALDKECNRLFQPEGDGPREPRWADRILWHATPGTTVEKLSYSSAPRICTSSHCPVNGVFSVSTDALPLRAPPSTPQPQARMRLKLRELRAHLTGSWHASATENSAQQLVRPKQVFVVFSGRFFENSGCETPAVSQSLGLFDWPVNKCPALECKAHFNRAEAPLLHLDLFQSNVKGGLQPLGSCIVVLHDQAGGWVAGSEVHAAMEFKSNLTLSGFAAGTINGRLGVEWYVPTESKPGLFNTLSGILAQSVTTNAVKREQPIARVKGRTAVRIDPPVEVEGLGLG